MSREQAWDGEALQAVGSSQAPLRAQQCGIRLRAVEAYAKRPRSLPPLLHAEEYIRLE